MYTFVTTIASLSLSAVLICLHHSAQQRERIAECSGCAWRRKLLRMEGWLEHLLYFAADAAARKDWVQAAKALDTFSACVKHDAPLHVRSLLPHAAFPAPTACSYGDIPAATWHQAMQGSETCQAVAAILMDFSWQG